MYVFAQKLRQAPIRLTFCFLCPFNMVGQYRDNLVGLRVRLSASVLCLGFGGDFPFFPFFNVFCVLLFLFIYLFILDFILVC